MDSIISERRNKQRKVIEASALIPIGSSLLVLFYIIIIIIF